MEGKYLVSSKGSSATPLTEYGAVNECCEEGKGKEHEVDARRCENKVNKGKDSQPCSCTVTIGECTCGVKKSIQLEPWARYKTITMLVGLSLFGIWIIIISIIGYKGKL